MSVLESTKRVMRRWFISIPFFVLLGLALGYLISIAVIPKPDVAVLTISGTIVDQAYTDNILDALGNARESNNIKAVVLRIDSPGGGVGAVEQIYLDLLRLRLQKPVVASIGTVAASGGYYIAVASNFIYAESASIIGSIGASVSLPKPERLEEDVATSGPFKATGGTRRKSVTYLEMIKQEFIEAVVSQREERLRLSNEELSRAEIYLGSEGLRYGLIDDIGTRTAAIEKAASLAGLRNYGVTQFRIEKPSLWLFGSMDLAAFKAQTGLTPKYYYLYFERE